MNTGKIVGPSIKLPYTLEKALRKDRELAAAVFHALEVLADFTQSVKLPLLKEFNDHSYQHINVVLENAVNLIAPSTRKTISKDEAAVLALAVALHDAAMHIDHDHLVAVVERNNAGIAELGDLPWKHLWSDHIKGYQRMDVMDAQLKLNLPCSLSQNDFDLRSKTENSRYFQGDFIRKYHFRLAQEFSDLGLPTDSAALPQVSISTPFTFIKLLAGLTARSHGERLRSHLDYLLHIYKSDFRCPDGVRVIFLMTLLRLADYLHIGQDRARSSSRLFLPVKSYTSRIEWDINSAVIRDRSGDPDEESQHFTIEPTRLTDVKRFLRIEGYFQDLQSELDECWTVLGEVFGSSGPQIALRRVKTNLHHPDFRAKLAYAPEHIGARVSSPDILNLLISPLYGSRRDFAIRELQQNALDAVLTLRESMRLDGANIPEDQFYPISGHIEVSSYLGENGREKVTVTDKGVGMDLPTIRDIYLVAGSSYLRSKEWQDRFESHQSKVAIARRGKFGIGFLATFLATDSVNIVTRRYDQDFGLAFTVDANHLEHVEVHILRGELTPPVGTRISFECTDIQHKRLIKGGTLLSDSNWIATDIVDVSFVVDSTVNLAPVRQPLYRNGAMRFWREVEISPDLTICWTLNTKSATSTISLNSILVRETGRSYPLGRDIHDDLPLPIRMGLELSILDLNSRTEINLARTDLQLGFAINELRESFIKDSIARVLCAVDDLGSDGDLAYGRVRAALQSNLLLSSEGWWIRTSFTDTPSTCRFWICPLDNNEPTSVSDIDTLPENTFIALDGEWLPYNYAVEFTHGRALIYDSDDSSPDTTAIATVDLPVGYACLLTESASQKKRDDYSRSLFSEEQYLTEDFWAQLQWFNESSLSEDCLIVAVDRSANPSFTGKWFRFIHETPIPFDKSERADLLDWVYRELEEEISRWRNGFGHLTRQ